MFVVLCIVSRTDKLTLWDGIVHYSVGSHSAMIELYPWGWHMSCYMYLAATCDLYHASVLGALRTYSWEERCGEHTPWPGNTPTTTIPPAHRIHPPCFHPPAPCV